MNILVNVVQVVEQGGEICIEVYSDEQLYCLLVIDNGSGMEVVQLEQIFELFFIIKLIGQGIGLGLFIFQDIIQCYGGIFIVISVFGEGICIDICLLLVEKKCVYVV